MTLIRLTYENLNGNGKLDYLQKMCEWMLPKTYERMKENNNKERG